ncbi:DUF6527 family protein [Trinickia mobilis]|uniref:DUF6527 family protein n=1 Tax=Trinickia mobilis TaxID=2816356 RepID=UPI001A907846|nr:DUF6527 family protein [Trinickia mobilis]
MKTLRIALKAELTSRAGADEFLKAPGDAVLICRETPRWLLLQCPCGCGEQIPVNVDKRAGKAWRFYCDADKSVTLFPSVWRDTGCQSHFIIWRDRILMFGLDRVSGTAPVESIDIGSLAKRVLDVWPRAGLVPYVDVADTLNEIPWDVQEACRALVKSGRLIEGLGKQRGMFRRS